MFARVASQIGPQSPGSLRRSTARGWDVHRNALARSLGFLETAAITLPRALPRTDYWIDVAARWRGRVIVDMAGPQTAHRRSGFGAWLAIPLGW
jgi:hypothetical protein